MRAPLVPSDSLDTCTRTSWHRLSISSMGATASRRGGSASSPSVSATVGNVLGVLDDGRRRLHAAIGGVVARVEEGVLGETDVHEGGLHAGQDVGHRALVHAAHDRAVAVPLEVQLGEEVTFLDGDAGFERTRR